MALLVPTMNKAGKFTLSSLKMEMGEHNIKQTQEWEAYSLTEGWSQVVWDMEVGPLCKDGIVILFCHDNAMKALQSLQVSNI